MTQVTKYILFCLITIDTINDIFSKKFKYCTRVCDFLMLVILYYILKEIFTNK